MVTQNERLRGVISKQISRGMRGMLIPRDIGVTLSKIAQDLIFVHFDFKHDWIQSKLVQKK